MAHFFIIHFQCFARMYLILCWRHSAAFPHFIRRSRAIDAKKKICCLYSFWYNIILLILMYIFTWLTSTIELVKWMKRRTVKVFYHFICSFLCLVAVPKHCYYYNHFIFIMYQCRSFESFASGQSSHISIQPHILLNLASGGAPSSIFPSWLRVEDWCNPTFSYHMYYVIYDTLIVVSWSCMLAHGFLWSFVARIIPHLLLTYCFLNNRFLAPIHARVTRIANE